MKYISFICAIALAFCGSMRPAAEKFTHKEKCEFFDQAAQAIHQNNPFEWLQAIRTCPEIVQFNKRYHSTNATLIDYALSDHVNGRCRAFYINELLKRGAQLTPYALEKCLSFVCASICLSHASSTFEARLHALTTFYCTIEAAQLPPELMTETVATPQHWLQNKAHVFLDSKDTCTRCEISWPEHRPIFPGRLKQLRKALLLD